MSLADKIFKLNCKNILECGTDMTGLPTRPHWEDGTPAYTIKSFAQCAVYHLYDEFPALTLRQTFIKSAFKELLWIYQKKSNVISEVGSHVWDSWDVGDGTIGKAYGYQISIPYLHHTTENIEDLSNIDHTTYPSMVYSVSHNKKDYTKSVYNVYLDQMDAVLWDLKNNPFSRRIMTNTYNFKDLNDMGLYPCAYSMTYNVTKNPDTGKLVLNGILNQRSQDMLAASNWNVVQYALLLMMIAQSCDMEVGTLVHVVADAHIYDRHIDMVKELLTREEYPAPKVWFDPEIKNFYDFKPENLHIENYKYGESLGKIPVAI